MPEAHRLASRTEQSSGRLVVPTRGVSLPIFNACHQVVLAASAPWTTICRVTCPKGVEAVVTRFGNGCESATEPEDLTCWDDVWWRVTINEARVMQYGWEQFQGQRGTPWDPIEVLWCELTSTGGHYTPGRSQTCEIQCRNANAQVGYLVSGALAGYTI